MINYITITEYIDIETGEIITKKNADANYKKIKTEKSYDYNDVTEYNGYKWGTAKVKYQYQCEKSRQLNLFS